MSSRAEPSPTLEATQPAPKGEGSEFLLLDQEKISEEDRKEILDSIEKVAAENRLSANEALFRITPLKNGFIFPLVINIVAAIAVAAGFVGSNIYFSRQQATISGQAGTFFSAEGKLIEQVKKQSAQQLKAKDQEISAVKAKLAHLNQESSALRDNMQATIQAKEAQLKGQMQSQLAAERARLQTLGISQLEVNSRLAAFEKQKNTEFASQLAQYKQQSEAALKAKEQQIQTQQEQTRAALATANKERQQLLDQAKQQEAKLRAQYEAKNQQLQSANQQLQANASAAQQKLQALSSQAQSEQLVSDQIVGSYNTILQDIQRARYDQAKQDIASLEALLSSPSVGAIPALAKRRPVDMELLASLQELIKARTAPGQPVIDPAEVQRANQVTAAAKLVGQAQSAEKQGNTSGANDLYTRAIAQIPVIETAYKALQSLFDKRQAQAIGQREDTIAALRKEAAAKSAQIDQLTRNLAQTRSALQTTQTSVADLKRRLGGSDASLAGFGSQVANQDKQIADLKAELAKANASLASLKDRLTASDSRAADLQMQLAAATTAGGGSAKKLTAEAASAESYKKQLDQATAKNASLEKQLADNEAQIGKLTSDLADAQTKIQSLQGDVTQVMDTFSTVQGTYASYKSRLLSLIAAGTPQDIQRARSLLLQFIDGSGVNQVLPGFSTLTAQVADASAKTAETTGLQTGRNGAFNDVMKVTDYYLSPAGSSVASNDRALIDKAATADPLFRTTASDIQKLAERSGRAAGHQPLNVKYQLIGTISYISANTVTVEKLVNVPVSKGETVLIRHKSQAGNEVAIAEGKVIGQSSGSVEVSVESLLQGSTSPQLLDVVYLQPSAGA